MGEFFRKAWRMYYEGFRDMRLGRTLWFIIVLKLVIMFLVLKIFFFPSALGGLSDQQKAERVSRELIERNH